MSNADPIELLFGGMEKLGPGSDPDTLKVLEMLPRRVPQIIIDAGCGTGRQTLVLANRLQTTVHAVDNYEPFLVSLKRRAKDAGVEHLVETHCMDMAEIPNAFREIDLLWAEGSAYSIGFKHALRTWHSPLKPCGFLVVSELCWLHQDAPAEVTRFFQIEYPEMKTVDENRALAKNAGYDILATHTLAPETWVDGYYDVLEERARRLLDHPDKTVRDFAAGAVEEVRIFGGSKDSYGYVFYVLQKA
jgi:trans-aconitate methyltransferase